SDSGERLSGTFNYNAELFDASTIERWSQHLQTVLHGMAEDSQRHISALPLLTAQQRSQVVDLFNATAVSFPDEALIHELFQIQARQQPDADAVVYGHQRLTYAELNVRANQVAHFLIGLGVRPDQRVALCVERGLDMAVGILGILKAGAAYVPVDPDYPPNRQAHMLKDCRPVAVLSQQALLPRLPALQVPVLALDGLQAVSMLARHSSLDPQSRASGLTSRNLAYVIYTSGSTGQPKGVMVEHRSAVNFWQVMSRTTHARCEPRSRVALNAAFSFDMSLKGILQLLSGHCLMPIPQSIRANGVELLNFLVEHRIDAVDSTPSQLEGLLSAGLLEGGAYRPRSVLVGGEPIRSSLWGRLKSSPIVEFHNMYGPTEATVDATIVSIAGAAGGPTIGSPIDNARIYILDTARQPVPIGVIGEVHI
ncbi:AMP-binding protein, partial [Roseateles sp. P5_E1]